MGRSRSEDGEDALIFATRALHRGGNSFLGRPDVGDLSVEGVLFIPQEQSPKGAPFLVVAHETKR